MARKAHVRHAILSAAVLGIAATASHATLWESIIEWDGGAGSSNWADPANWRSRAVYPPDVLPTETDPIEFGYFSGSDPLTITLGQNRAVDSLTIDRAGTLTLGSPTDIAAGASLTLNGGAIFVNYSSPVPQVIACNLVLGSQGLISGSGSKADLLLQGILSDAGRGYGLTISGYGSGVVTFSAANTYAGPTRVENSILRLAGQNGSILPTPQITVSGVGSAWYLPTLQIDNTAGNNNNNRVADQTPITLQSKAQLTYLGQASADSTETFGDLVLDGSNATITLTPGPDGTANLISSALVRTNGGYALIRAQNLGTGTSANASSLKFKTAPTLIGGAGPAGSPSVSIIPFLTATTSSTNSVGSLVTYDPGPDAIPGTPDDRGVRPLDATTEYAPYASAGPNDNVRVTESLTGVQGKTINSLSLSSWPDGNATRLSGTGGLNIKSGVILGPTNAATISGFSDLYFNDREAILGSVTITSPISHANGLTAVGNVTLLGNRHRYTGTTRILGSLEIDSPAALGNSGGDGVILNSGTLSVREGMTLSRPFTIAPGSSSITLNTGQSLIFTAPIQASGDLKLSATGWNPAITTGLFKFQNDATFAQQLDISDAGDVTFAGKTSIHELKMHPWSQKKRPTLTLSGTSSIERLDADGLVEILISGDTEIGKGGLNVNHSKDAILKLTGKITGTGGISLSSLGGQGGTLISPRSQPSLNSTFLSGVTALLGADASLGAGYLSIDGSIVKNTDSASHTYTHTKVRMNNATLGGTGSADMTFVSTTPGELSNNITIDNNGLTPVTVTYSGPLQNSSFTKLGSGTLVLTGSEKSTWATSATIKEGTLVLNKPAGTPVLAWGSILEAAGTGRVVWQSDEQLAEESLSWWMLSDSALLDLNGHTEKQSVIRFASSLRTMPATGAGSITTGPQGKLTMVSSFPSTEAQIVLAPSATATARISGNLELSSPTLFNISDGSQPIDMLIDAALSGPGDIKKTGAGVLQLTGPNASTGKTTVNAGTLVLTGDSLPAGAIDLNSRLVVRADRFSRDSLLSELTQRLKSPGALTSSSALADPKHLTGLALIPNRSDSGAPLFTQFAGLPLTANDILLMYTWNGDMNLDGKIDASDYFLIDSGYITQKAGYRHGDLNYDGKVDASDYFLIDSAFIGQTGTLTPLTSPVPEPDILAFLAVVAGVLAVDRRRSQRG